MSVASPQGLGDLAGIVPLLIVYCAAGLLALVLLRHPQMGN
ncbi:MAG TPA: hypothetical protein VKA82_13480 [Rubrobacter sp.]|nr:hypothetical protein [Rubrobacter sp.]